MKNKSAAWIYVVYLCYYYMTPRKDEGEQGKGQ